MKPELSQPTVDFNSHLFDDWFDPIETGIGDRVRELIEEMIRCELDAVLSRPRYGRRAKHAEGLDVAAGVAGHRHGSRIRTLMGTGGQGHGEPGVAQGEDRLGRMEYDGHPCP